jgi:hypothetical protein
MQRAPSCLLFAGFLLSVDLVMPEGALAQAGIRHSTPAQHARGTRPLAGGEHRIGSQHRAEDRRLHGWPQSRSFQRYRSGFLPYQPWSWPYVETAGDETPLILENGPAPAPSRVLPGIPSVMDLPVSAGIRNSPAAAPTIYVLGSDKRSLRRGGGAKVLTMDPDDAGTEASSGPRIIHLNVPRR